MHMLLSISIAAPGGQSKNLVLKYIESDSPRPQPQSWKPKWLKWTRFFLVEIFIFLSPDLDRQ